MSSVTGLLDQMRTKRSQLKSQITEELEAAERAGRTDLLPSERQALADLKELEKSIEFQEGEAARRGTLPKFAEQRAINSAGRVAPLHLPTEELRRMHAAVQRGEPCEISAEKRFTSADSLLPPELYPYPIEFQHEWRLLDRLPGYATDLPSIQFIQHVSTTGAAGTVAEGALKPEVTLVADKLVADVAKIAGWLSLSREIIDDWSAFSQYATAELYKILIDAENLQLLTASGTGTDMTGFYPTAGILTHDCSADTGTAETPLDSVEKAIAELRSGSALAEPDLAIFHPEDWSALRRIKDDLGRFILAPDPSTDEVNTLWGIPVLVTTQNPLGKALLVDTRKFGQVAIRSPLSLRPGYNADDHIRNLLTFVAEERLVLTVTRPAAVLKLVNLPAPTTREAEEKPTRAPAKKS